MKDETNRLVLNRIQTPDGTILTSRHVHDYQTYKDKNGETYMVDGGLSYQRGNVCKEPPIDLCVYLFEGHEKVREAFEWGTYGIDGNKAKHWVQLKGMASEHITAILATQHHISPWVRELFEEELKYRLLTGSRNSCVIDAPSKDKPTGKKQITFYKRKGRTDSTIGTPIGCLVAIKHNSKVRIGWSLYNKKAEMKGGTTWDDRAIKRVNFTKKMARELAMDRTKFPDIFNTDDRNKFPHSLFRDLEGFSERVKKYFKVDVIDNIPTGRA